MIKVVHQWTQKTTPSIKSRAMAPTTHTAAIIKAVEDKAVALLVEHHQDVEVTMVTMEMEMEASPREIIKHKMVINQPAGTVTSTDTLKKTDVNESGRMLLAKVSMDGPTGQNKKLHLWGKKKENKKPRGPLEKSTQEN
jgi:hypothetical protein